MMEKKNQTNAAVIEAAQLIKTVVRHGKRRKRIPYGKERQDWGADRQPCHDCGVVKGQLHIPGCAVEECPVCRGQRALCEIVATFLEKPKNMPNERERFFENHVTIQCEAKCPDIHCPVCGAKATRTRNPCPHLLFSLEAVFLKEVTIKHLHPKLDAAWNEYEKGDKAYWDANDLACELRLDPKRALLISVTVRTGSKGTDFVEHAAAFKFPTESTMPKGRERGGAKRT